MGSAVWLSGNPDADGYLLFYMDIDTAINDLQATLDAKVTEIFKQFPGCSVDILAKVQWVLDTTIVSWKNQCLDDAECCDKARDGQTTCSVSQELARSATTPPELAHGRTTSRANDDRMSLSLAPTRSRYGLTGEDEAAATSSSYAEAPLVDGDGLRKSVVERRESPLIGLIDNNSVSVRDHVPPHITYSDDKTKMAMEGQTSIDSVTAKRASSDDMAQSIMDSRHEATSEDNDQSRPTSPDCSGVGTSSLSDISFGRSHSNISRDLDIMADSNKHRKRKPPAKRIPEKTKRVNTSKSDALTALPCCLRPFHPSAGSPNDVYPMILARLKKRDPSDALLLTRIFYAIGSPESFQQLKDACQLVRKRHVMSIPAVDSSEAQSPQGLGPKAIRALDKLDREPSVESILRRGHLANLRSDRNRRQIEYRIQNSSKRSRIAGPGNVKFRPQKANRGAGRVSVRVINDLLDDAYPELRLLDKSDQVYKKKAASLHQKVSNGRHWLALEEKYSPGILAIVPTGDTVGISNSDVEHLQDDAFQVLLDLLDEHRGKFLHEVGRSLIKIYSVLLQEHLELKYRFECSGDLTACEFDSQLLLKMCHSQRSSAEFRRNDGASTSSDLDAPLTSTPAIQIHAVQHNQMSRSAYCSPRIRSMSSPQVLRHDKNSGPAVQIPAQARSSSLPELDSQDYSRIRSCQPTSITLPSLARTEPSSDLERFQLDPRGHSFFDNGFHTPCISGTPNKVTYSSDFPFPSDHWNYFSTDHTLVPSTPPDSANSTFSSMIDYSNCTTAPSVCQDRSNFPLSNAQSRGVAEESEVVPTHRKAPFSNRLSARDASVVSNLELAIPQPGLDDTGIKVHLHDAKQDIQRSANQWYNNDEDDDIQTATRKAEEQMRSADDVVSEVHDDTSADCTQQADRENTDGDIQSELTIKIPIGTASDKFSEGPIEQTASSSVDAHAPIQAIEAPTFGEVQAETIGGSTSLQDKREPIYHEATSVNDAANSAMPGILIIASRQKGSDIAVVSGDAAMSTDRPDSMFPGGSLAPSHMNQFNEQPSSQHPMLSKKRNLPTEPEEADVHLRPRKTLNKAQLRSWEPFRETVDVVGRIWRNLDHARIYVTSSIEVKELSAQQHPNQGRLWSWLKEDQELFDRQMSSLLRKKFGFQVVCSDAHSQGRRYCSLDHMEYWNAYFGDNERGYWLAILTPWRSAGSSRKKVRKTYDDKNL